jgi:hypothetical protein
MMRLACKPFETSEQPGLSGSFPGMLQRRIVVSELQTDLTKKHIFIAPDNTAPQRKTSEQEPSCHPTLLKSQRIKSRRIKSISQARRQHCH